METNRIFSEQIEIILSQPFIKLTEGLQAFIYISKDGKYILKTFKNLEQSKEQFKKWGLNPDDINHELIENSDKSYRLAFDKLRKETGLICIRLSNEPLPVEKIINTSQTCTIAKCRITNICHATRNNYARY